MSIGTAIRIEDLSFMQSFFPGDSMYIFYKGDQICDADGNRLMIDVNASAYLMTVIARWWFENKEDAIAYIEANYDTHWFEAEQGEKVDPKATMEEIQEILKDVPVNPPPKEPPSE